MLQPGQPISQEQALTLLLDQAENQGYLTAEDFLEISLHTKNNPNFRKQLQDTLTQLGVLVLEREDTPATRENNESPEDAFKLANIDDLVIEDIVEIYFQEMARVPLLKLDEEIKLAKCIEAGREAANELAKLPRRSPKMTRTFIETQIRNGELARDHLIKANTRLVVSIAKRYTGRGVPFLDLVQEGNLGLMKAVEKFDYRRGFRFSTYATWWIRQTITRAIADQGRTIRLPVHMNDRIRKMYRLAHEIEQKIGRPATIEELASELDLPAKKVQWMQQVSWLPLSLETPIGDDDDAELGAFIVDEKNPTPSQVLYHKNLRERVDEILSLLTPREARIIRLRYGLDNNRPYTLEEVGEKFGLTRERIRQIEGKALRHLRNPCVTQQLRDCL